MRTALLSIAFLASLLAAGCGDSDSDVDARPATIDSAVDSPDGQPPDAPVAEADATATADARPDEVDGAAAADVEAVCTDLCDQQSSCSGSDDPSCVSDCTGELGSCSDNELSAVANCTGVPCPGMEPCLMAVPCAGGL
jgi:hypothetical protein